MEKIKNNIVLISVVGLFLLVVVIYNLLLPHFDTDESSTDNIDYSDSNSNGDVDAEDVFNFIADNDYAYYADDEYLTKSQSEYRDEVFKEAAQEFGISESEACDLYDEYAKELGLDGSDSIDENSGSSSNSYSIYTNHSTKDEPTYKYSKDDTYSAKYDDDNDGKVSEDEYMQGMSDLIDDLYENYVN